jgi:hypothetical protein
VYPNGRHGKPVFAADPDRLDITRDDPPAMQTFGGSITKAARRMAA